MEIASRGSLKDGVSPSLWATPQMTCNFSRKYNLIHPSGLSKCHTLMCYTAYYRAQDARLLMMGAGHTLMRYVMNRLTPNMIAM